MIIDYADKNGLTLHLMAQAYGHPTSTMLDNKQLEEFYTKFGFERDPNQPQLSRFPIGMIRHPRHI